MLSGGENIRESKLRYLFTSPLQPGTLTGRSTTLTPSYMAKDPDHLTFLQWEPIPPQNAHLWPAL